jgi:hypothetical protein
VQDVKEVLSKFAPPQGPRNIPNLPGPPKLIPPNSIGFFGMALGKFIKKFEHEVNSLRAQFICKSLCRLINWENFSRIREKYKDYNPDPGSSKYLDIDYWLKENIKRALKLKLEKGKKLRILDIGCGTGYFLFVCRYFGHLGLSLDLDEDPMYREMVALLGMKK